MPSMSLKRQALTPITTATINADSAHAGRFRRGFSCRKPEAVYQILINAAVTYMKPMPAKNPPNTTGENNAAWRSGFWRIM